MLKRVAIDCGKPIVMSTNDIVAITIETSDLSIPVFSLDELLGQTYLQEMDDGQQMQARVSRKILDMDAADHQEIKFLTEVDKGTFDEILAYCPQDGLQVDLQTYGYGISKSPQV